MTGTMRIGFPLLLAVTCLALRAIPAGVNWCPISAEAMFAEACCTQVPASDSCCAPEPDPATDCCLSLDDEPATELAPLPQVPELVALGHAGRSDPATLDPPAAARLRARAPPEPLPDPHLRDRRGIQLLI